MVASSDADHLERLGTASAHRAVSITETSESALLALVPRTIAIGSGSEPEGSALPPCGHHFAAHGVQQHSNHGVCVLVSQPGENLYDLVDAIIAHAPVGATAGTRLGTSREGRPVRGFRLGSGPVRVSLIAGCHADEPVGPRFLARLAAYLGSVPPEHDLLTAYQWWIVPHINPDGAERNRHWHDGDRPILPSDVYDPVRYLSHVVRELPGDDLEFGFPALGEDPEVRPESRAVLAWWQSAGGPFHLHATLHGIAMAGGPWFLLEPAWLDRVQHVMRVCAAEVHRLGYTLHDVERQGEKGFHRIEPGFCTRPTSAAMREHFRRLGDEDTANRFRPNSMEAIRSLGGDPLTLVSEMPLFITPGVGKELGPPDPVGERWKDRRAGWHVALRRAAEGRREAAEAVEPGTPQDTEEVRSQISADIRSQIAAEIRESGLMPMPILDQMRLQWRLVSAGLEQVRVEQEGGPLDQGSASS